MEWIAAAVQVVIFTVAAMSIYALHHKLNVIGSKLGVRFYQVQGKEVGTESHREP